SGEEDAEITDYFIRSALPPREQIEAVLDALNHADEGLTVPRLEQRLNLSKGQIDKVLKLLEVESPSPVAKVGSVWQATAVAYRYNQARADRLHEIRRAEEARMLGYLEGARCLMAFLAVELDDPDTRPCGHCAVCLKREL